MPCYFGGPQLTFGTNLFFVTPWDNESRTNLYNPQYQYDYQKRGHFMVRDQYGHLPYWSPSLFMSGCVMPSIMPGQDNQATGRYEVSFYGEDSVWRPYFIRGQCRDQANNPVAGAIVQGFLTASDLYIGQTVCDDTGYYSLGSVYNGQNHYLVAYKAGSPDIAGTTVNTLQPVT